ncbi:MAG: P-loop NTPase, partial [Pseudomonadota bacterium]|nr:P-loop NTPase [Pseudomonadota bacterium]
MTQSVVNILVVNSKGGCGKTTVATNLAAAYANGGKSVALFD